MLLSAPNNEHNQAYCVLVVDDDVTSRLLARQALKRDGFTIAEAEDGLQALYVFEAVQPDIVLMDVDMPNLDGFEACRQLRCLPHGKSVPILMVTGRDDIDSIERAYKAGATDFATKPTNWLILGHRLLYMLRAGEVLCELQKSEARLDNAQRIARLGNWEWDLITNEVYWSEHLYRLLELRPGREPPSLEMFLSKVHPDEQKALHLWFERALKSEHSSRISHRLVLKGERTVQVQHQAEVSFDRDGNPCLMSGTVLDVTQLKEAEERIRQLAHFDNLTGLANRFVFKERVQQALDLSRRNQRRTAVLFLDLDNFKRVNDTLGHTAGDLLLKEVAKRITSCVRSSDRICRLDKRQVARFGGDEFTLLLSEVHHIDDAARVAERILEVLARPVDLQGQEVVVTSSVGIAVYPEHGADVDDLLKNADTAMYCAKKSGKNRYEFFIHSMNEKAERRLTLENYLRKALENGELYLDYQPQVELATNKIVGVEALLRWQSITLGSVSPAEFIPLAEDSGLIVAIGEWVLRQACGQAKAWFDAGLPTIRIAVNLSVRQFLENDLVALVAQVLEDTGLSAELLELEITESVLIDDAKGAVEQLHKLKALGVQIAIDDFGTGYSSLSYLKRFPIDRLKIDRSFVSNVTSNSNDAALTLAMVAMAHSLKLNIIAEGVESEDQHAFLKQRRCDEMQGYYFSRPINHQLMAELLNVQQSGGDAVQLIHSSQG